LLPTKQTVHHKTKIYPVLPRRAFALKSVCSAHILDQFPVYPKETTIK